MAEQGCSVRLTPVVAARRGPPFNTGKGRRLIFNLRFTSVAIQSLTAA
ncbi:hypothetical protein U14_00741 [Candidatus Moduliflexus flocculans]|uniref:Uncharacterized protein n=1 Tax=Candidatus Moduliflexus flocculans TaxID=1499966 RepID=A0A0S6VUR0_9BACT|nr:hypothetical protein U14_00741 [Candidatus Moduliflexus flocculans]